MKYRIQTMFRGRRHYIWCSPNFEAAALPRYAIGAGLPPSSDPATIYRQLHHAVRTKDQGDNKIIDQKKVLKALALKWFKDNQISADDRDEIIAMVSKSDFLDWKPLLYVIPYGAVAGRAQLVPRGKRASHEPEYILVDLADTEFQIIEPWPCP
jgi:hypothetical protein